MGRFVQIFSFSVLFGTLGIFAFVVGGWVKSEEPTTELHAFLEGDRPIDLASVSVTRGGATVRCEDRAFLDALLDRMARADKLPQLRMPTDAINITFALGGGESTVVHATWSADTSTLVIAVPKLEPREFAVPGYAGRDRYAVLLDGDLPAAGEPLLDLIRKPAAATPASAPIAPPT